MVIKKGLAMGGRRLPLVTKKENMEIVEGDFYIA